MRRSQTFPYILAICLAPFAILRGQQQPSTPAPPRIGAAIEPLGDGPFIFDTAEQHKLRVVVVTKDLSHPWALVFLPNGDMLITERPGRLRIFHNGALDPTPVSGVPAVVNRRLLGLMDVAIHPKFAENRLVYLAYTKAGEKNTVANVVARARLEGDTLTGLREIFHTEFWEAGGGTAERIAFGRDGMLYIATGGGGEKAAQDPSSYLGKVLRVTDTGEVPPDNPFVHVSGHKPEIYSLGHRNTLGLAVNPVTGEMWENENGPNGGDEINILAPGKNYGWPLVSYGRTYEGPRVSEHPWVEGTEAPLVSWIPSIAVSGMAFYTGDRFQAWKGNVFVGGLRTGEIPGTGHLERIVFNSKFEELRRESLLTELHQRIREVRQGPDGLLYLLTDENAGALLRLEPAP